MRSSGTRIGNGGGHGGPAKGPGRGGPAKGPGTGKPNVPIVAGRPPIGAETLNDDPTEQAFRTARRKRIRQLREFAENNQVHVMNQARSVGDLSLLSQAADRLLGKLPPEAPVSVELSGPDGGPVRVDTRALASLSDDDLERAIAQFAACRA